VAKFCPLVVKLLPTCSTTVGVSSVGGVVTVVQHVRNNVRVVEFGTNPTQATSTATLTIVKRQLLSREHTKYKVFQFKTMQCNRIVKYLRQSLLHIISFCLFMLHSLPVYVLQWFR